MVPGGSQTQRYRPFPIARLLPIANQGGACLSGSHELGISAGRLLSRPAANRGSGKDVPQSTPVTVDDENGGDEQRADGPVSIHPPAGWIPPGEEPANTPTLSDSAARSAVEDSTRGLPSGSCAKSWMLRPIHCRPKSRR